MYPRTYTNATQIRPCAAGASASDEGGNNTTVLLPTLVGVVLGVALIALVLGVAVCAVTRQKRKTKEKQKLADKAKGLSGSPTPRHYVSPDNK